MFSFLIGLPSYVPFVKFPICITSDNTGSSQNVSILAKGEPLTVLVTLLFYYKRKVHKSILYFPEIYTKIDRGKIGYFVE